MFPKLAVVFCLLLSLTSLSVMVDGKNRADDPCPNGCPTQKCNITILGGGAAGLSFAYYLVKAEGVSDPSQICIVEKNNYPGGRIYDVELDSSEPDKVYGTCAIRINQNQIIPRCLAKDLNVQLEDVERVWRVHLRGSGPYGGTDGALLIPCDDQGFSVSGYPTAMEGICSKYNLSEIQDGTIDMTSTNPDDWLAECYYFDKLINVDDGCGWSVIPADQHPFTNGEIKNYPDVRSFTTEWLGYEQTYFMKDEDRFRSDFRSGVDALSWTDYIYWDWNNNYGGNFYPVGGMSALMYGMADFLTSHGVQIYLNEKVTSVQSVPGNKYPLKVYSNQRLYISKYVISTIPNKQFADVTGDVGVKLNNDPIFNHILPIETATVAMTWPYRWWDEFIPGNGELRIELRTMWTGLCLNSAEFPGNNYAKDQNVSRISYTDDLECLKMWKYFVSTPDGNQLAVEEILRELKLVFPEVNLPDPLNISIKIQPVAWHFYASGTPATNQQLFDFALEPIPGLPFSLAGETFHLQFSGWSLAAFTSSLNLLKNKFGIDTSQFENCALCGPNELGLLTGTPCGTLPECDCSDPQNECYPQCSTVSLKSVIKNYTDKLSMREAGKSKILYGPSR